jgi:RNA polymerase sigma factor (sigma-70 family)
VVIAAGEPWRLDEQAETIADDQVAVDDAASDRQELATVKRAIATLPMNLKEPLVLRTIEGFSQAETAEVLGISQKAVETRLYRARARLVERLGASQGVGARDA